MKLNNNDDSHNSGLNLLIYNMLLDIESHPAWVCGLKPLGVIGSATPSGWDADTDMTYNEEDGSWNLTTNLTDGEIKIRANNDWDINWGGSIAEPTFNAGNIAVTAGNYTIRFIPQCDGMNLLTLTKN